MKKINNAIIISLIISVAILIVSLAAIFSFAPSHGSENKINVQGVATVKTMPDRIVIYFNIRTKGETSLEAKTENSKILNKLIGDLVSEEGLKREDIVTESFNIYPEYDWSNNKRREIGYSANQIISVNLPSNDSMKVSRSLDIGISAGASLNRLSFELDQETQSKYKAQAMKLASKDARMKAEAVAEGVGKELGEIISVEISDFGYRPWLVYENSNGLMKADAITEEIGSNIQPGEREISATVNVVFELE